MTGGMEPKDESRPQRGPDGEEAVPLFGTWRRIYAAVVLSALITMGLLALFSSWPY